MARFRGAALALLGGVAGSIVVGVAFTGCGGDDTMATDGGGGNDGTVAPDTSTDGMTTSDVQTTDARDGGGDARVDADANNGSDARDTGTPDADARAPDGEAGAPDADAGRPDADSGVADADAGPDVAVIPPGLLAYPHNYATALCASAAACCGATFDTALCENTLFKVGYDNTLPSNDIYGAGHLTFNPDAGAACISALQTFPCAATLTSAQNQAILSACHGVLGGTIAIGGTGCVSSFECVSGAFCNAATGTCTALAGDGGSCSPAGETPDQECSYIGTGLPGLYCDVYPDDGGGGDAGGANRLGTCQPTLANGVNSICSDGLNYFSDYVCTGRTCDIVVTGTCLATIGNPQDPTVGYQCGNYVLMPDAGGD